MICNRNGYTVPQAADYSPLFYSHTTYVQPGFHVKVHGPSLLVGTEPRWVPVWLLLLTKVEFDGLVWTVCSRIYTDLRIFYQPNSLS